MPVIKMPNLALWNIETARSCPCLFPSDWMTFFPHKRILLLFVVLYIGLRSQSCPRIVLAGIHLQTPSPCFRFMLFGKLLLNTFNALITVLGVGHRFFKVSGRMPASVTLIFWAGQKQGGYSVGSAGRAEMWPGKGHGRRSRNQVLWATWQGKPPLMLLHPYLPLSFVFLTISLGLLPVSSASTAVQSFPGTPLLSRSLCYSSGLFCTQALHTARPQQRKQSQHPGRRTFISPVMHWKPSPLFSRHLSHRFHSKSHW